MDNRRVIGCNPKMSRTAQLYLVITSVALLGIVGILKLGRDLTPAGRAAPPVSLTQSATVSTGAPASAVSAATQSLYKNGSSGLSRLFLQLLVIVAVAALFGALFTRIGQPAVVGEMVAGIVLGPSLLAWVAPSLFNFLFAPSTLLPLNLFSQIGVCLFMFVVGMELDVSRLRQQVQTAIVVSHASIVIPYLLGVTLTLFLYESLAPAGASFAAFALFMGIGMSITAFPVLVRMLKDRRMTRTPVGTMATACAAVDDVTAWTVLAFVIAIAKATTLSGAILTLALVVTFVGCMLILVRPALAWCLGMADMEKPEPSKAALAIVLGLVLASSFSTETIGIHALFGAFLAGAIIPRASDFREKLAVRVENISSVLLLPVFFAFTGLRTQIGLLKDPSDWVICLVIIAVATFGKLGGSAFAARLTGSDSRFALQLGALMNTRGLMELIALNIGYDMGILSQRIFAMLVIMALVTTALTGPLLILFRARSENLVPIHNGVSDA
ncbi:MAG TPA: cation:proton antiporter [Chthoniobacterales bacterium]|jgi:Kef-type K+ transport system membrane component KefB